MTSMNLSLPEPLKLFVDEQVTKGGYNTVGEYLLELIKVNGSRPTARCIKTSGDFRSRDFRRISSISSR
jgi:antitoxin ParD1/3/4